jgi:hypothetical protein
MLRRRPIITPPETGVAAAAEAGRDAALCDLRFRALLGASAWARLPAAVRARFSKRLQPSLAITYAGRITLALHSSGRTFSRISTKPWRHATTSCPISPLKPRNS